MSEMNLTKEQANTLFWEVDKDDEWGEFKVIEQGEWEDDGKYQYRDTIFKYGGKIWSFTVDRSGSYFSDYHYGILDDRDGVEAYEVEKVKVITHRWAAVKDKKA